MSNEPNQQHITLVPTKSDKDLADEYRQRLREAFRPILDIMDEASKNGLLVGFNIARDPFGKAIIQEIQVNKPL